jgi:hypothetical protein
VSNADAWSLAIVALVIGVVAVVIFVLLSRP